MGATLWEHTVGHWPPTQVGVIVPQSSLAVEFSQMAGQIDTISLSDLSTDIVNI